VVRFHGERSFDRSYCRKNVGTDGNPFQDSKTYHHLKEALMCNKWYLVLEIIKKWPETKVFQL
jgi:hypothetical protein